jgi:hypothetical protein
MIYERSTAVMCVPSSADTESPASSHNAKGKVQDTVARIMLDNPSFTEDEAREHLLILLNAGRRQAEQKT